MPNQKNPGCKDRGIRKGGVKKKYGKQPFSSLKGSGAVPELLDKKEEVDDTGKLSKLIKAG